MALSHTFITGITEQRDGLYALAAAPFAAQTPPLPAATIAAKAEAILVKAAREAFAAYAADAAIDPVAAIQKQLPPAPPGATVAPVAMPADIWARLTGAIQVDAAQSLGSRALNPDSVLLSPDPLLAPKKQSGPDDDAFDLSPPSRFLLATAIAVCIGIALTIYIVSRGSPPPQPYPVPPGPYGVPTSASAPASQVPPGTQPR